MKSANKFGVVLFDFDGTVVDTGPGIVASMTKIDKELNLGLPISDTWRYIGPPLTAFAASLGFDEEKSSRFIRAFRAYYNTQGWKQSEPYPGIRQLLADLIDSGAKAYVCTSKPETIASMMMDYYALPNSGVCGSDEALGRFDKAEIIQYAALRHGFPLSPATVMVGDAPRDVTAGRECGLSTVAVRYGYGRREDLDEADAGAYAGSVSALRELLL